MNNNTTVKSAFRDPDTGLYKSEWHDENGIYQRVKSAWQNDRGFYEVRNGFCSVPDEVPKILSGEELDRLMEIMHDYNFIIVENPTYRETKNKLNP